MNKKFVYNINFSKIYTIIKINKWQLWLMI